MSETLLQKHWYDGWFYARFIDSELGPRKRVLGFIEPGSTVIDVGCGTGGFALKLAGKCKRVVGVDISGKQIQAAQKRVTKAGVKNVEFVHGNAADLTRLSGLKFDYATCSLVIHEVPQQQRLQILQSMKKAADTIVIFDYNTPPPADFWGFMVRTIEFFAGKEHFKNFKDFVRRGGLNPLVKESDLSIKEEKINRVKIFKTVACQEAES